MPETKIVRPADYEAYECDGPTCQEVCESHWGSACDWVQLELPHDHRERRYFCSWACLAEWAFWRQERLPLRTRKAPVNVGLPF